MNESIDICGKMYDLEIDQEKFGYKDKELYKVHKTTKSVMVMGCVGVMRFIFDEKGKSIAESYPMMNLNNDFTFVSLSEIQRSKDILEAYEKIKKKK